MDTIPAVMVTAAAACAGWMIWRHSFGRETKKAAFPNLPAPPVIGSLLELGTPNFAKKVYAANTPSIARVSGFPELLIFDDPALIRQVMAKPNPSFLFLGDPKFGLLPGLQNVYGNAHKRLRMFGNHVVSKRSLDFAYEQLNIYISNVCSNLEEVTKTNAASVFPIMKGVAFDAVCILFVGGSKLQLDEMKGFSTGFTAMADMFFQRFLPDWMDFKGAIPKGFAARNKIIEQTRKIVSERRIQMLNGDRFDDGLASLLDAADAEGNGLEDDEIVSLFLFMVVAAIETTSDQLTTLVHHLVTALPAADLDALRREVSAPHALDSVSTLSALPLLDAFIKESQRIHTAVPLVVRVAAEDFDLNGVRVPAGTGLAPYRDRGFLVDAPEEFRIARFLGPDAFDKTNPMEFIPFGTGQRQCLGMNLAKLEMKLVVATLLKCYEVTKGPQKTIVSYFPNRRIESTVFVRFYSAGPTPLTKESIQERVLNVLKDFDKVDASKLALDSHSITDLGLDSLDQVEITIAVEDEFNIELSDRDADDILTPGASMCQQSSNVKLHVPQRRKRGVSERLSNKRHVIKSEKRLLFSVERDEDKSIQLMIAADEGK
ncbi:hypothetical protein HDU83_003879 [Entophlyctis luteolus]|nr:hypothetical protein HDU83_003879 [Entophlyctis luteolus]